MDLFTYLLATHRIPKKGSTTPSSELYIDNAVGQVNKLSMTKESTQETTTGKNKITFNNLSDGTSLGITRNFNNSEMKLNGTTSGEGVVIPVQSLGITLTAGTYTISYRIKSGNVTNIGSTKDVALYLRNSTTPGASSHITTNTLTEIVNTTSKIGSTTFTLTEDTLLYFYGYCNSREIVLNNLVLEVQIEEGPSATDYEQFTGNLPSPSPDYPQTVNVVEDGIDVKITGKNLFDKNNSNIINGYLNSDGTTTLNINWRTSDYIKLNNTQNLTISGSSGIPVNCFYTKDKTFISYFNMNNATTKTVEIPNNAYYFRASLPVANINIYQIEYGSSATTYEPYKESIVSVPLNGNEIVGIGDYKDNLYVDKFGKWYLLKKNTKMVFNGTENWITRTISENRTLYETFDLPAGLFSTSSLDLGLCNKYIASMLFVNDNTFRVVNGNGLGIRNDTIGSLSNFLDNLENNNLVLYYPLATPQLIDLNFTKRVVLFRGINNITNSADAEMTIEYY